MKTKTKIMIGAGAGLALLLIVRSRQSSTTSADGSPTLVTKNVASLSQLTTRPGATRLAGLGSLSGGCF